MAANLQKAFGGNVQIVESSGGVFEIERDDQLLYSKTATGRFPEDNEVLDIVNALAKGIDLSDARKAAAAGLK